jgi:hypothetical protein
MQIERGKIKFTVGFRVREGKSPGLRNPGQTYPFPKKRIHIHYGKVTTKRAKRGITFSVSISF